MFTAHQRHTAGASSALWEDVHAMATLTSHAVPKATRTGNGVNRKSPTKT